MKIKGEWQPITEIETDVLAVVGFDKDSPGGGVVWETTKLADKATGGWIEGLYKNGAFIGKPFEIEVLHRPAGMRAKRLALVGAGKSDKFNPADLRRLAGAAVRTLRSKGARSLVLALESGAPDDLLAAAVEGAILAEYDPDLYKTEKENKAVETFGVAVSGAAREQVLNAARIVAESQNFTRQLASEPANRLSPSILAQRARQMAAEQGLDCEVLDQNRMKQLGMGALLGVAQGSLEPAAFIVVRYQPANPATGATHLGLVGKGVTFDTGGISIKPSDGMEKMKYDMSGGAAVLGAMRAIAQLKPAIPVTGFIPAVENMPGGGAQRPGDIVTTLSGKTVEVLNTDAEGRLILADALTYATRLGCTHLVDVATLTGAISVALGAVNVGLFANDDALRDRVVEASHREGEKMWPMPVDEEYKELLKSVYADLPNIGTRAGGAITAAMFLKEFADPKPWVHLDIAGTAWLDENKPFLPKGATGVGVRTLVRLAMDWR